MPDVVLLVIELRNSSRPDLNAHILGNSRHIDRVHDGLFGLLKYLQSKKSLNIRKNLSKKINAMQLQTKSKGNTMILLKAFPFALVNVTCKI